MLCAFGEHLQLTLTVFSFLFSGKHLRAKRMVEAANPSEYEYAEGSIPMEWDGKFGQQHPCYIF